MRKFLAAYLCLFLLLSPAVLHADDATAVCLAMVTDAAHNINISTSSSQFLYTIFDAYCKSDGSTKSSSWNAGISAVIESIPVSLTGGSSDASTAFSNFCRNYASTAAGSSTSYSMQSSVVEKAVESANQCLTIASRGSTIAYRIFPPKTLAINFNIGAGNILNIRGLSHDNEEVTCQGAKATGTGVVNYSIGSGQNISSAAGAYSITCTRTGKSIAEGVVEYPAQALVLTTNEGNMDIYWPKDSLLPLNDANQIRASITALNTRVDTTTGIASDAQAKLATIAANYGNAIPAASGQGPAGNGVIQKTTVLACPNGQYLAGLKLDWAGTCQNQCNADGGVLHVVTPVCKPLF